MSDPAESDRDGDVSGGLAGSGGGVADDEARPDRAELYPEVPEWDDEYLDRIADRLMFNYDLAKDVTYRGEHFALAGEMRIESQRQFMHPSINFANHESMEYLLARRQEAVRVADLERLVDLGHELADSWIEPDEEHFGTDITFAVVVPDIPEAVQSFVDGFRNRTLLRYGFHGHYELNLVVVAPDREEVVASKSASVGSAFALWADVTQGDDRGLLHRIFSKLMG